MHDSATTAQPLALPDGQDFINMIALEDRRREEIEREIAALEIEERSHIERLRALQEEQKAAYDSLEAALAS